MKLRRRRRVKAFPQKRSQLGGCGLLPENGVWGHAPPGAFGRAAASPQTRQMRCWPSSERTTNPSSHRKRQDSLSLSLVLFPPKLLRGVSAGALFGEVIKLPFCIFSAFLCGGGITTLGPLWLCRNNPARGLFQQKKRLSQSGCSAPTNALFSPEHSAFLVPLCGVVSLPSACASCCWNAGRAGVTAAYLLFLCRSGIRPVWAEDPHDGYTRHPSLEPRTQRLTRRNTVGFHRLRHRQGR